jgi:hypothetical protein
MAGTTGQNSKPLAKEKAKFGQRQSFVTPSSPRHWSLTAILIIVGGLATMAGLVRPIVNPPHDIWVVALGVACVLIGMATGLHEIFRNWGKTIATLVVFLILIVVIVADRWTREFQAAQPGAEKSPSQAEPTVVPDAQFQPPRFEPALTPNVRINSGSVVIGLLRSSLINCPPYKPGALCPFPLTIPMPLNLGGFDPISVCVDNNRVFVNVRLSDDRPSGNEAEIIHDHFTIQPTNWDRNFDEEAFEAVDKNQQPVLQLIYRSPSEILVRGVFIVRGAVWVLTENGLMGAFPLANLPRIQAMPALKIRPIFKYPHEKYLHVRS